MPFHFRARRFLPRFLPLFLPLVLPAFLATGASAAPDRPLRLILVGDSTMASSTGYGDALCARLTPDTACLNLARGGRSSGSFRAEGRWDEVQSLLRAGEAFGASYVLIQFGHNDQPGKPGRSTDIVNEFPANMRRYVEETRAAGGIPVLVTPLTRRSFRGAWVHDDLAPWSAAVRQVARETTTALVDLNALSMADVQAMGPRQADALARAGANFDHTHVGPAGAERYGSMMAHALRRQVPGMAAAFGSAR
ncbi:rhamnogalacturonan acetylesterase [Massilia oculi]|uniref:Hydrolase n=1 Tax=Massilia oculi TaxID=945844 RepID=A0A2S2DPV3_9BURK|nr:rhamnogalacturonan acetylesterase [Massilia oculi]AWL07415.1 hydrolase [Massilia oculi]